jgi:hypothetical protein
MTRRFPWAALALAALVGCAEPASDPTTGAGASTAAADAAPKAPSADDLAQIDKLADEADRVAAKAQKVCPITGEPLGSMGLPLKKEVDGKPVFLCCKGCEADFDKDPKAALAKLAAAPAEPAK